MTSNGAPSSVRPSAGTESAQPEIDFEFRDAMRHLAGGVSVVTVGGDDDRTGFTATSVTSLSVEPATVLVCLDRRSSSWPVLQTHNFFGVNILGVDHRDVAERFAGRGGLKGGARYEGVEWTTLATGAPVLADAMVALDCEIEELLERHSHAIIIGRVRALRVNGSTNALVYWRAGFHSVEIS